MVIALLFLLICNKMASPMLLGQSLLLTILAKSLVPNRLLRWVKLLQEQMERGLDRIRSHTRNRCNHLIIETITLLIVSTGFAIFTTFPSCLKFQYIAIIKKLNFPNDRKSTCTFLTH